MDTNSSNTRSMLDTGSLGDLLDSLSVDHREDFVIVSPDASEAPAPFVLARLGRAVISLSAGERLAVLVHPHHDADRDEECYAGMVEHAREAIAQHNAAALFVREHAGVQELITAGFPPALAAQMNGVHLPDVSFA